MRLVTCGECGEKLDKAEAAYEKPKYYHKECYAQKLKRRELFDYVCQLFHLKVPGPANYALRKKYVAEGMTDDEILKTLRYAYEIKHIDKKKADDRIGIVPYYREAALKYFNAIESQQREIASSMAQKIYESQHEMKQIMRPAAQSVPHARAHLIDESTILEEED